MTMTLMKFDNAVRDGDAEGVRRALAEGGVPEPGWVIDAAGVGHLAIVQMLWPYADSKMQQAAVMIRAAANAHPHVLAWGLTQCRLSEENGWKAYTYTLPAPTVYGDFVELDANGNPPTVDYTTRQVQCRQLLHDAGVKPDEVVAWLLQTKTGHKQRLWLGWHVLPFKDFPTALIDQAYRAYVDWKTEGTGTGTLLDQIITAPTLVMEWERRQLDQVVPSEVAHPNRARPTRL